MDCIATRLPYRQTNYFSKIILDYLDHAEGLKSFYAHPPSLHGIQKAINNRQGFANRTILARELRKQYGDSMNEPVKRNIELLLSKNTFTITTAHQPNIFTGPLYFVYKIVHAIKLAEYCKRSLPQYNFVPVYYMGSEDADLAELGHVYMGGEKIEWKTKQTGAVGRMKVDKDFRRIIEAISGQLAVLPFGKEIISSIKTCYADGMLIQDATLRFVQSLFGDYGLIVLIPDNGALKKLGTTVFQDDLLNETPSAIVEQTAARLHAAGYKVQVNPREINLFYLKDGMRERIVRVKDKFLTHDSRLSFDEKEILKELED
ncbi:MAG TPA: bacillithiol biosynthesis BshC, partial [Chitinophagaceae bacterium]|nr:bacillithiol biosynthesis BshC [Chitinophagaceae bacterium]